MLTFLTLCLLALIVLPIAVVCFVGALLGGIVWIVLFPIRLIFRVLFGVAGLALGVLFMPVIVVVVALAVVVALIVAAFAALAPLLPLAAVGLIGWAIYKGVSRRPSPAI